EHVRPRSTRPTSPIVQKWGGSSPTPAPPPAFESPPFSAPPPPAMNSLSLSPFYSACNTSTLPKLKPLYTLHHHSYTNVNQKQRIRKGRCRAELLHEAPFVVAIGACVLNSLAFPLPVGPDDNEDGNSVIDSADARFAVMGIISFIPYFNWMSWVFAWMDTGDKRYAFYAILEASIKNGDLQSFQLFNGALRNTSSKKDARISEQGTRKDGQRLPSAHDESRNKIRSWGIPKKPAQQANHLDEEEEEGKKH
ncbi:hypothetical protein Ccrd_002649, partial [Cynara cardunculus var. scolymus]